MPVEPVRECDVLVAGSGAAGLTAALTAAHYGLSVIVAESEPVLGGTTARTSGSMWLPGNALAARRGIADSAESARRYLRAMAGECYDAQRVDAFLHNAPRVLDFFELRTAVRVFCPVYGSDYHPELPGGVEVGRALYTEPFDGRLLERHFDLLAAPIPELTFLGIAPQLGTELAHFVRANRSPRSALYVACRLARRAYDQCVYGRATRLTNGTALAARLVRSALDIGIPLWTSSPVTGLQVRDGRVLGATLKHASREIEVRTRCGVVLACGGFSHDPTLRQAFFPAMQANRAYWSATAPGATGSGLRLGESVGAALSNRLSNPAAWSPVSLVPRGNGEVGVLPVLRGRGVPGLIAITPNGQRFVNEANSYHEFGQALIAATAANEEPSAFLVCDAAALRRYGLGHVRPFPVPHGKALRSGYLMRGATVARLARTAGIDPPGLQETVELFNREARKGRDPAFGKGTTPYNRRMGDADHAPNPCVAPLETPPFFAIKVLLGDIGTYAGLSTDARARVLDPQGRPIAGLYAAGNDMASIFGGSYPAGGTMLGQAVTFGFIAGCDLAGADDTV